MSPKGYGIRVNGWNGGSLNNLQLSTGLGTGGDAYWPDVTGDFVKNWLGNSVPSAEADRSACFLGGGGGLVLDVQIESNEYEDYPCLLLDNSAKHVFGVRMEGTSDTMGRRRQSKTPILIRDGIGSRVGEVQYYAKFTAGGDPEEQTPDRVVKMENCTSCRVESVKAYNVRLQVVEVDSTCDDCVVENAVPVYCQSRGGSETYLAANTVRPDRHVLDEGNRTIIDGEKQGWATIADGVTTPSLRLVKMTSGGNNVPSSLKIWSHWQFAAQTTPLSVTEFTDLSEGLEFIAARAATGNTVTLVHNAEKIVLNGAVNRVLGVGEFIRFVVKGTVCYELY